MNTYSYSYTFVNPKTKKKKKRFLLVKANNVLGAQCIAETYVKNQEHEMYMDTLMLKDIQLSA